MTSGNLSLGDRIRNRKKYINSTLWTSLIALPLMAIYYIFGLIMTITRTFNYAEVSGQSMNKFYNSKLDAVIVVMGFKQIGWLLAMFIAIMFAYQGFSYLFSQSKLDFYLSQPTTRYQRIRKNFANAIGTFTLMYVAVEIIALIVAACFGAVNGPVLLNVLVETIRTIITFSVVYSVTVLAMFLSGNMPTAILLTGFFAFIPAIISWVLLELKDMFFATYVDRGELNVYLSPLADRVYNFISAREYLEGLNYNQNYNAVFDFIKTNWMHELDTIIVGIVAFILVFTVSKARRVEHAGKSIIFRPFRWIVKISICVISGILAILFMHTIYFSKQNIRTHILICIIMVITAVIVGCVIEVLFDNNNIKSFNKGIAQTLMAVAILFLIFMIHKGDLCGYDSYIPNPDSVESCAFIDGPCTYSYYTHSDNYFEDYAEDNMYITDVDSFIEIAKVGMASMKQNSAIMKESGIYQNTGWNKTILYRLKNGKKIYRNILIPYDVDPALMDKIISSDEYKTGEFECFGDDVLRNLNNKDNVQTVDYSNGFEAVSTTTISYGELSDAYRKDVLENYSYSLCTNELPIGQINFTSSGSGDYINAQLDVYPEYKNTIALLEKNNAMLPDKVDASKVDSITVYNFYSGLDFENMTDDEKISVTNPKQVMVKYTDKKQIQEILDAMVNYSFPGEWFSRKYYTTPQYSIDINSGKTMYGGYGNGFYSFKHGEVPDFVVKDTNQ
ncbi:hypothetical protein D6853_03260 [Butyrivibrio sp. X503]|uniref:DUF6449 domain-containing protein n=1 Tax=Butyrivibrio sp. X503 TaxID=2364878 RepID=UPI000EA9B7D7|nr:DUF6449 domain-containing protein [Butyrivibrio sp. X503]RKM57049.1 hypothetical protein D6853_03260 [Butyrivibrio sp. X503]